MWRSLVAIVLVYGTGHPNLDGYRPALLDRPLQSFYRSVNETGRWGQKAIASIDGTSWMRYLRVYVARMDTQLRGSGGGNAQGGASPGGNSQD
jgi:hypothetical protein